MTQTIVEVIGYASNTVIADRLHDLGHDGAVEYIILQREDTLRRRLRVSSETGNEYLIALPRDQQLLDGAVLVLDPQHALVVRMAEEQWLGLLPSDLSSAVELGYFSGKLHWRVKFNGPELHIALEGPEKDYLTRLQPFLQSNRVKHITSD